MAEHYDWTKDIQASNLVIEQELQKNPKLVKYEKVIEELGKVCQFLTKMTGQDFSLRIFEYKDRLEINIVAQTKSNSSGFWGKTITYFSVSVQFAAAGLAFVPLVGGATLPLVGLVSEKVASTVGAAAQPLSYAGQSAEKIKGVTIDEQNNIKKTIQQFEAEELKRLRNEADQQGQKADQSGLEAQRLRKEVINQTHEIWRQILASA